MKLKKVVSNLLSMGLVLLAIPLGAVMAAEKPTWAYSPGGSYAVLIASPREGDAITIGEDIAFQFDRKHPQSGNFNNYAGIFTIAEDGSPNTSSGIARNYNLDAAILEDEYFSISLDTGGLQPGEYYFGYGIRDKEGKNPDNFAAQYMRITLLAAKPEASPQPSAIPSPRPTASPSPSGAEAPATGPVDASDEGKWVESGLRWKYQLEGVWLSDGWYNIEDKWYLFDSNGYMLNGWQKRGSNWYYLGFNGAMRIGWCKVGNLWYYMSSSGIMQTGWRQITSPAGSKWYYFHTSGTMHSGWLLYESEGSKTADWYYLRPGGDMAVGWQKVGSAWHYFEPSGRMYKGWLNIFGNWYYLAPENGVMVTGSRIIGGKRYTFAANGEWQR